MKDQFLVIAWLAVIVITAGVLYRFGFPASPPHRPLDTQTILDEIDRLILTEHDCDAVLEKTNVLIAREPSSVDAWRLKGACEFDLGKVDDAKQSFDKVLALDPANVVAKNYLEEVTASRENEQVITGETPFQTTEGTEL